MIHRIKDQKALERYRQLIKSISEDNAVNPFESQADQNLRIDRAKRDYAFFIDTYFKRYASSPSANFHTTQPKKSGTINTSNYYSHGDAA